MVSCAQIEYGIFFVRAFARANIGSCGVWTKKENIICANSESSPRTFAAPVIFNQKPKINIYLFGRRRRRHCHLLSPVRAASLRNKNRPSKSNDKTHTHHKKISKSNIEENIAAKNRTAKTAIKAKKRMAKRRSDSLLNELEFIDYYLYTPKNADADAVND